ncbi:PhzF family phenazine biosynthesis protein [Priestia filamentosa]|uniref:Phenazine biosynthesis protein n=1 Tax=Priestia filamentosa TaxID=1402861 RepID=A0A1X7DI03_9BACI|nr:PhzF family phenazine biosynthesis protein [Priestia filamentosa]AKO93406.1 phenazine biosynthesis protein [Priestia filamentosa]MDT3763592.1 PhzF family phenazine biosynthesis protein [Priestia filamentosa]OXS71912.1 phenazine biosynthesis protein [Priestia filamentosa]WCM14241.1 PhzF family phenazine biosynthesis protein [Priestia filamentosa]WRU94024.1 PhzF family phenazine biosynthesis protein [Priestia filamentosa]
MTIKFHIVDVFSKGRYSGNQLAVFENAHHLSTEEMQKIAKEVNFSETTFLLDDKERDGAWDVRIFTPTEEVPFAGHPTLGTAHIIRQHLLEADVKNITLRYKIGPISVTFEEDGKVFMLQNEPTFGKTIEKEEAAAVLNIGTEELCDTYPVQEVSTGLPVIIAPIKTLQTVKNIVVNERAYFEMIKDREAKAIMVFCPETVEGNTLHARDFCSYYGVPEDPATGSANGCLGAYCIYHNYFRESSISMTVEQGYEIGRPSLLFVKVKKDEKFYIEVGGYVEHIASGAWNV